MDIRLLRKELDTGKLSAFELVTQSLDQIDRLDGIAAAWFEVTGEQALAAARRSDERRARPGSDASLSAERPLDGIPIGIKDNVAVAGMSLEVGSPGYRGARAVADATVTARLRRAGAIILGKQRMHELGLGDAVASGPYRTSRHPWNDDYVPGGSSCGSAVATALSMAVGSVGGDTGGSVRNPAASCGVVGFKPTYGIVPSDGVVPLCWSMDTLGFFARDVGTVASLFAAAVSGPEPALDPPAQSLKAKLFTVESLGDLSTSVARVMESARSALLAGGSQLSGGGQLPIADAISVWQSRLVEMRWAHAVGTSQNLEAFGPSVRDLMEHAGDEVGLSYGSSWQAGMDLTARLDEALGENDVFLLPANPTPALTWDQWTDSGKDGSDVFDWYRLLVPFNVSGHPAVVIPWEVDPDTGLPVAVQLVGRHGADAELLAAAAFVEDLAPGVSYPVAGARS